jgi:hypothetical protein
MDYNSKTVLFLSSCLHAVILFSILTFIYIKFISVIETNIFQKEISGILDDNLPQSLKDSDKDQIIKNILQNMPLDRIAKLYSSPEPSTLIYNTWLKRLMVFSIVLGLSVFIISCLILSLSCNKKIPYKHIFTENILIFTCVGLFEAYFFFNIGKKYVPVLPSTAIETLYSKFKQW